MGRTTRWLKSWFGVKKLDKGEEQSSNSGVRPGCLGHSGREMKEAHHTPGLCQNPNTIPPNITPAEAAWLRSFYLEPDNEQSKHAIAVAAATAAAADAAVAAAQAAVAMVRLTSQGRGTAFGGGREKCAATKIQTVFRGFLARKALKALKGLVKLQALVRGYLVRKQATATLYSMQALIRAQASIRARRTRGLVTSSENSQSQFQHRKSVERHDEATSQQKSIHGRRLSTSSDSNNTNAIEESTKIVEVDTGRPKSKSRRSTNTLVSDSGDESSGQTLSSPCPYQPPPRISILVSRNSQDFEWGLTGNECRGYSTAQSTPRFASSCGTNGPVTPAKSVCVESLLSYVNCPNYMTNTQSFMAKQRSQSAPKQRPEPGSKRRLSVHEMMESRNSLSGARMQRSCSQVQEVVNFKNAILGKLGRSSEFVREPFRD